MRGFSRWLVSIALACTDWTVQTIVLTSLILPSLNKLGSVALLGLFLAIKFLGPEWINFAMSWYFFFASLYSLPDVRFPIILTPISLCTFTVYLTPSPTGTREAFPIYDGQSVLG